MRKSLTFYKDIKTLKLLYECKEKIIKDKLSEVSS